MSLHGAPLLCLAFEDEARDIKERWARGEKNSLLAWHRSVIFSRTKGMMAIGTLRFDMIYRLMAINKALTTDAREQGYLQVFHLMVQRKKDKAEISANKNLNKMVKHLFICLTLGHRKQGKCEGGWRWDKREKMRLYLLPPNRQPPKCNVCILQFGMAGRWKDAGERHIDPLWPVRCLLVCSKHLGSERRLHR